MSCETPAADNLTQLIAAEEAKGNRHLSEAQRFALIEQTIAWAEAQSTVQRNTKEACLREQARLLAQLQHFERANAEPAVPVGQLHGSSSPR